MPGAITIRPATLTRGITYLYRWWVQAELGVVPEAYVRKGGQATLVCPKWAFVGSPEKVDPEEVALLREDLGRPVFVCCPDLAPGLAGLDIRCSRVTDLPEDLVRLLTVLEEKQGFLETLGEENPGREEWWKTRESGAFGLWKGRGTLLVLEPEAAARYAFSIRPSSDGGKFFVRSRTDREEGQRKYSGMYKLSEHALPTGRKVSCLDLIYDDGKVLLLRLQPAGAGFKVFRRRTPGYEGTLG